MSIYLLDRSQNVIQSFREILKCYLVDEPHASAGILCGTRGSKRIGTTFLWIPVHSLCSLKTDAQRFSSLFVIQKITSQWNQTFSWKNFSFLLLYYKASFSHFLFSETLLLRSSTGQSSNVFTKPDIHCYSFTQETSASHTRAAY